MELVFTVFGAFLLVFPHKNVCSHADIISMHRLTSPCVPPFSDLCFLRRERSRHVSGCSVTLSPAVFYLFCTCFLLVFCRFVHIFPVLNNVKTLILWFLLFRCELCFLLSSEKNTGHLTGLFRWKSIHHKKEKRKC